MFCKNCGTEFSDDVKVCPSCGAQVEEVAQPAVQVEASVPAKLKMSGKALAGFIVALVGILLLPIPCGVVGVIFSALGLADALKKRARGLGFAIAGLAIGVFNIIYGIFSLFVAATLLAELL